jgi:hypothetical protein
MEEEIIEPTYNKPLWSKLLGFFVILGVCLLAGSAALLLFAKLGGLPIVEGVDIFEAIADPELRPFIKAGIGFNHLIIFTGTSLCFAFWLKRKEWFKYFDTNDLDVSLVLSFVILLFCAYPLIGISATIFENVEWASQIDEGSIDALMKMLQMDSIGDLVVNLIIIAMLPAIGEELLFRGVIQKELISRIKNHHIAIVIASIIFSGVHLQIQGFLPKFIIGIILGYAYYWTKSIWYPMILHFINNGMQTLILYFVGDQMDAMQEEAIKPEISYLVIGVVFSCFLCFLILQRIQKQIKLKHSINP